ncbi:MAG: hypothetical protein ACOYIQ_04085 [Christensenellales bacterium]|jgi:spore maturation protein A
MNAVFVIILIASIALLLFRDPAKVLPAMLTGGTGGVNLALKLAVIYSVWLSLLIILERAGIDKKIASLIKNPLRKLFPKEDAQTYLYLSLNLSCNILGMGGAATPLGIKAVENMSCQKNKIMLVVINSASIQLIPTTIIAMRASFLSKTDIIIPSLIASVFSTLLAAITVALLVRENKRC